MPRKLGAVALLVVLAVGIAAYFGFRQVLVARERLVGPELDALLETSRLRAASEHAARLGREFLLTGRMSLVREASVARAEARALAVRAAGRPETQAIAQALLDAQERQDERWRAFAAARGDGAPAAELGERFEREIVPLRAQVDAAITQLEVVRDAALAGRRRELEAAAQGSVAALVAATAAGFLLSLLLWMLLRRSLAALRESEIRYRTTFENAPVGIAHIALDGTWLRVNPRYQALLGHGEDELRRLTVPDVTHPDDRAKDAELRERLRRGELDTYGVEKRYVRKDGHVAWVNLTVSMVRDESGAPSYFIAAAEDVAARKAVEDELRASVEARDEFIQIASHELRTPLTSLRLQVESLRGALGREDRDPARSIAKAEAALRQVTRLGELVDGLLDASRLEEGELAIHPEPGDLAAAVRAVVERIGADAERRGVELHAEVPASVPARFDRARVEQAVAHLVSNALKYGQGKPVDVTLEVRGDAARVAVRDRGIGVDPGEHERIFGRFERAVSTLHYGGFGLGLFVARRTAEGHGGTLTVESTPAGGATFVLALPLAGAAARLRAAASPAPEPG